MIAQGGGFPIIRGAFLGDPHEKDYNILGSVLGSFSVNFQEQN